MKIGENIRVKGGWIFRTDPDIVGQKYLAEVEGGGFHPHVRQFNSKVKAAAWLQLRLKAREGELKNEYKLQKV